MSVSRIDQQYLTIFAIFDYVLQYCIISKYFKISDNVIEELTILHLKIFNKIRLLNRQYLKILHNIQPYITVSVNFKEYLTISGNIYQCLTLSSNI